MFFPAHLTETIRLNAERDTWAASIREQIVAAAQPWMDWTDDELWALMFGNTITRSWMVWSNGHCPACEQQVHMYTWEIEPFRYPWKARCPYCKALFPKNDFGAFYRSGLDEQHLFDPQRADRRLLFNEEHPDPADPLHRFGVDDGEGVVDGEQRWRFIGTVLIYGQWKTLIVGGIKRLAEAYTVTGNPAYAHKAGLLLDRVSDVYPTFDFAREGQVYEEPGSRGYISTWHDACHEVQELVLAYDQVREVLEHDRELVHFLARKAREFSVPNPKKSWEDIRRNIEDRILRDTLTNRPKIESNFPTTDMALILIETVLDWPDSRDEVYRLFDEVIAKATRVDGLSGEKGLAGYATITPRTLASYLGLYARVEPNFLREMLARHPRFRDMYRFHLDTWCMQRYYPTAGDSGAFGRPGETYAAVPFGNERTAGVAPSMYTFFWQLYEATGDPAFVQVLLHANGGKVDGLPYDLFADDPERFRQQVREVIAREGAAPRVHSVNKEAWHLAILRAGEGDQARAAWLDYDSGEPSGLYAHRIDPKVRGRGGHSHADGMNLGLYAKGLDLMPDFGYPPVNFGGWSSPQAEWYKMTAGHNTVVVDGLDHMTAGGTTTLWLEGQQARGIRVSAPDLIEGQQFERTVFMVDMGARDSYMLDVFRVVGGKDHAKFMHSHFAEMETKGLTLKPAAEYGHGTLMRHFRMDEAPPSGWSVDWKIEDRYRLREPGADIHLRYTDLSRDVQAFTCEAWVMEGYSGQSKEAWIPRIMVRRQAEQAPLASTFVGVIEPYEGTSNIAGIRRLELETTEGETYPDAHVALEVHLQDGRRDLLIAADVENPLGLSPSIAQNRALVQSAWDVELDGEMCLVRRNPDGRVERIVLGKGRSLRVGDVVLKLNKGADFIPACWSNGVME